MYLTAGGRYFRFFADHPRVRVGALREMRIAGVWINMSKRSVTYWQVAFPTLIYSYIGVLTPGKNNRMILANTEQLHDRIDLIMARNRELENALRSLQDTVSDQPHPLLLEKDRLNLKITIQQGSSSDPSTPSSSKSPSTSRISPANQPHDVAETRLEEDRPKVDAYGLSFSSFLRKGNI